MNKTAKRLGMDGTNYNNPHGLINKYNKSNAIDQARLSAISMQN